MDQKTIKNKIKEHENKLFDKKELKDLVNSMCLEQKDRDETISFMAQYIQYSAKDDKFQLNVKKKQTKSQATDYISMLKAPDDVDSEVEPEEIKQIDIKNFAPFGTQWIHDVQVDDELTDANKKMIEHFNVLRAIKSPEQRSEEWHKIRYEKITASDGGQVLGQNKYDAQFNFLIKKTVGSPFKSNEACYHGKKFEQSATMIYEYRMNVLVDSFGLLPHPRIDFLGASPDGICNPFKNDGKHASKFVGRMLEIKCPFRRKIIKTGEIIDNICPISYWIQVQLQLECCELDECDFWQCDIREYVNREAFILDTDPHQQFRSKYFGLEKGCLIQLMPKSRKKEAVGEKYFEILYEEAIFIYPTTIEMSVSDCDKWTSETILNLPTNPKYKDFYLDKVIYWRLEDSGCVTINRDKKWFADNLPKYKQMWDYVLFLRKNKDKLDLFMSYINSLSIKKNKDIMDVVDKLANTQAPNYKEYLKTLKVTIDNNKIKQTVLAEKKSSYRSNSDNLGGYMFVD